MGGRRIVLGIVVLATVAALVVGGWFWSMSARLSDVPRFDAHLGEKPAPGEPMRPGPPGDKESVTILLAGIDHGNRHDLVEMLGSGDWQSGVFRSDAVMVLHLSGDRKEAHLVSIPRDSWVVVPGHGEQKINAAFSEGGPALLAQTVEQVANIRLTHMMVVGWDGFRGITDVLGGVTIDGEHLGPEEALTYVRERKSLPRGDFDRVERQRKFLMSILRSVQEQDLLSDPPSVTRVVGMLDDFVSVDKSLTNRGMVSLARAAQDIDREQITLLTAPHEGTDMVDGQSVVRLDIPATRSLFDEILAKSPRSETP